MDSETGLYYLRARYMNPETATFTSMDSYAGNIYDPASLHRYLYANANPVKYTDPSGHSPLVSLTTSVRCLVMNDVTKILCTMAVMSGLINMGLKALRQGYNNLFCDANEDFDVRDYIESFVEGLVGGALLGTLAITIAFMANMQLLTMYAMLLGVSVVMGVIQIAIATYNSDELGVAISAVFLLLSVFAVSKLWGLKQKTVVNKTDGKAKVIEVEDGTVKTKTEPCINEDTPVAGEDGNSGNVGKGGTNKVSKSRLKHVHTKHNPKKVAQQLPHNQNEIRESSTYFNKDWSATEIEEAVNFGYNEALKQGIKNGKYTYTYHGEKITVCLEKGLFKTGYGDYTYSLEDLLGLIGGE